MIKYIKGNIFKLAPKEAYLCHACNTQGVWGSGIAAQFAKLYPEDHKQYTKYCNKYNGELKGAIITKNKVVCLFTSALFGKYKDSPEEILENTEIALMQLVGLLPPQAVVYSNKFNSGLFNVPWEDTEVLVNHFLKHFRPDVTWVVVDYDLG